MVHNTRRRPLLMPPFALLFGLSVGSVLAGCAGLSGYSAVSSDSSWGSGATVGEARADSVSLEVPVDEESQQRPESGLLTAGEWRDLDHWTFWRDLVGDPQTPTTWTPLVERWGLETRTRIPVWVHAGERPVVDARVQLRDPQERLTYWSARTDADGRAELFLPAGTPLAQVVILVESDDASRAVVELSEGLLQADDLRVIEVAMSAVHPPAQVLDLMFVIDTTGSMSDELSYLQAEVGDVIQRVQQTNGQSLNIRTSVNFYRDHGDEYVVRSYAFEEDLDEVVDQLEDQRATGGGDYEEAVDEALLDAIRDHDWSDSARARLLFLVLDAPPHQQAEILDHLSEAIADAALQGIRIIPLASSGVNTETECLLRELAILTGGTYTFLTNDSGIGGDHLEPTIGPYQVERLNDLLVRLINRAVMGATPVAR